MLEDIKIVVIKSGYISSKSFNKIVNSHLKQLFKTYKINLYKIDNDTNIKILIFPINLHSYPQFSILAQNMILSSFSSLTLP